MSYAILGWREKKYRGRWDFGTILVYLANHNVNYITCKQLLSFFLPKFIWQAIKVVATLPVHIWRSVEPLGFASLSVGRVRRLRFKINFPLCLAVNNSSVAAFRVNIGTMMMRASIQKRVLFERRRSWALPETCFKQLGESSDNQ